MKINMKNFIYYNSVAAHPHHLMGYNGEDHQQNGLSKH
jgi:hypothetical protein